MLKFIWGCVVVYMLGLGIFIAGSILVEWPVLILPVSAVIFLIAMMQRSHAADQKARALAVVKDRPTKTFDENGHAIYHYYDDYGNEIETLHMAPASEPEPIQYRRVTLEEGWR